MGGTPCLLLPLAVETIPKGATEHWSYACPEHRKGKTTE
jgi:hypothetical protein